MWNRTRQSPVEKRSALPGDTPFSSEQVNGRGSSAIRRQRAGGSVGSKVETLPKVLSSAGIDAPVLDNFDFYGEVIPMRLGMPYAVLSNALHFDYSSYTPLCVYGWAHSNTPEATFSLFGCKPGKSGSADEIRCG
jgi:hypothetical protein